MIHYFGLSMDEVLWGMSWTNIIMLTASIPTFDRKGTKDADKSKEASPSELLQKLNR